MLSPNFSPFPVLETERLILRCLTYDDAPLMLALRSNESVNNYLNKKPEKNIAEINAKIKDILENLKKNEGIFWVIAFKNKPAALIGAIGYWRMQPQDYRAEVGYMLHPSHWQKGIMKEALHAVVEYGFKEINLHSIEANINPDNLPSASLLESCGFIQEAYHRENFFYDGVFYDSIIYSRIKINV
ncbi:GNAT family protein [soil metagenome]